MQKFNPLIEVSVDGLYTPVVRQWSLQKYKLVGSYCDIFTTGMKNQWDQLVYIDLFSGAGYAQIQETNKTYRSSALVAMSIPNPFSKYILCEQDQQRFKALEDRIKRDFSHLNYELICGDSNQNIENIVKAIPPFRRGNTLLPFCFIDPFSLNLHFSTIEALGRNLMDFLILQALHMDANRNLDNYLREENNKIEKYLGMPDWRTEFEKDELENRKNFVKFLVENYQGKMAALGYQADKLMHQIRSNEQNLPLYYLSFYSKNQRGEEFFKQVQKRINIQLSLDF